jgi:hypothetical protein
MASQPDAAAPRLAFVHVDDVPWTEVVAQLHGERRVSVHEKFLEWTPQRMVVLGRYDPNVVIERHGHASDHLVYVLEGELQVGDRLCPAGTLIVLEHGPASGRSSRARRSAAVRDVGRQSSSGARRQGRVLRAAEGTRHRPTAESEVRQTGDGVEATRRRQRRLRVIERHRLQADAAEPAPPRGPRAARPRLGCPLLSARFTEDCAA